MNTKNFFFILLFWINIQTFCFAQTNPYRFYYSTNLDSIVCIWDLSNDDIDTFKIQFQDPNDPNNYLHYGLKIDVDQFYYYVAATEKIYKYNTNNRKLEYLTTNPGFKKLIYFNFHSFFHIDDKTFLINEGDINRDDWQNHIFNIDSMKNIPTKICWRRLGMIRHCNGRDVLLVGTNPPSDARTPSNKIVSKIFDGNMLYDGLEYDNNGYYISTDIIKSEYHFSFSPSGKKVLYQIAFFEHRSLYIGDFDRKTGKISNVKDYTYLLKSDLSSYGEFQRATFLNEDEVIITYVGGRLERLEKVYWYKLNLKTMQFDSVGFSVRELALNPNIIDRFGIEDTNNIRFDILSFCPNPNSLPYDQKVFFPVIISHYKRNAEGEYDYLRIRRHFVADIKDFSDVKFESKLIIGQNDSENPIYGVNDWYKILRFTYCSPYLASYIPTELDAGFRYQIGSSCQGNEYNVEFTDTSCCHFYRIWDFGDGTVSDTLWVTQHWEFAGKIDSFRTVSHKYTQPGRYKVKLKILNPYNYGEHLPLGEFVMDSTEKWIEIPPCIEPGIGLRDTLCVFDTLEVIYTGSENVDSLKLMTKPSGEVIKSIERNSNGRVTFTEPGLYRLELQALNAYYDTTWIYPDVIVVLDCDELWIPNAFTPNNDGMNDVFSYVCRNCVWHSLEIFNRDTQPIFRCEGSDACVWLGKTEKGFVSDGVYVYRLKVIKRDGKLVERVGTVTVMR